MAAIFKRKKSKFWYVKYYVNGQQVYRSLQTTSERVARKFKEQIEADETREPGRTFDLLLVEDFATVRQKVSMASVSFDDDAVADFFESQVDAGRRIFSRRT